jgi:hypothetical protein
MERPTPRRLKACILFQRYKLSAKIFNFPGSFTPPHDLGKSLHVGKRPSDSCKTSIATPLLFPGMQQKSKRLVARQIAWTGGENLPLIASIYHSPESSRSGY